MDNKISRRELLKVLIAGSGGIAAAGFLPEKWLKPVVKSGVLPVHAQSSAPQNYVEGAGWIGEFGGVIYAEAYVGSQPFVYPTSTSDLNQVKTFTIPFPVADVEVTLFIDGEEYPEKKITNEFGNVYWDIQYDIPNGLNDTKPSDGIVLRFVIPGDEDEFIIPLIN